MKLTDLFEIHAVQGEMMPRSNTPKADALGRFFAKEAIKRFGSLSSDGVTYNHTKEDPVSRAKQMAGNYYQAMLNAIDDEFAMSKVTVRKA